MKLFKRILPLFLALMIAASATVLASCSDNADEPSKTTVSATEQTPTVSEEPTVSTSGEPVVSTSGEPVASTSAEPVASSSEESVASVSKEPTASAPDETYAYTISFVCVDSEGKEITKEIKTNEQFLRGALEQENLIKGDEREWGLYVKEVCGITADYDTDGAYWALYIGDEYAQTGVDTTALVSGTTYKFVYEVYTPAE